MDNRKFNFGEKVYLNYFFNKTALVSKKFLLDVLFCFKLIEDYNFNLNEMISNKKVHIILFIVFECFLMLNK
jgi:hypothetical protein